MAYNPAIPDGGTPCPPLPDGRAEFGRRYEIPARTGMAVRLSAGERLSVINPSGSQVCDFFALVANAPAEFLSMEHIRTDIGRVYVKEGDHLVSNRRRALLKLVEDSSHGVHDILIACCDQPRYRQLGAQGYHDNCADNFRHALTALGVCPVHVPSPLNLWMNIPVAADGGYTWEAPTSKAGDYVVLEALEPVIAVMSACPQDMTPVNGKTGATGPLQFQVD
jgi:uncharacterized protein YcgI (DUF1989 family)